MTHERTHARNAIAHELANLMTAIAGLTEFLGARIESGSPLRRDWELLQLAAQRAVALQSRWVDLNAVHAAELPGCDLGATLLEWQSTLRDVVGPAIDLRLTLRPSSATSVAAERSRVAQVLLGLAAHVRACLPDGGALHIEVASDEGSGHASLLVRGSAARVVAADGLALAEASRVARALGGVILPIDSANTAGPAFEVWLRRNP